MPSQSFTRLHHRLPLTFFSGDASSSSPVTQPSSLPLLAVWNLGPKEQRNFYRLQCKAMSKSNNEEYRNVYQNGMRVIKRYGIVKHDREDKAVDEECATKKIKEHVESVRSMLGSMEDGEISVSAYDTAWVALVPNLDGSGGPQFPSSLRWIAENQLPDGSWGDTSIFEAHDRIINTLACVVALKSWNVHLHKCQKGTSFIKENISKLEDANREHMPRGFKVVFPALIEIARKLDIQVPDDSPVLQEIYAKRNLKLTRIPKDIMHSVPTTLLYSLEGMAPEQLEWKKLLKLQCPDGSFFSSPSSTAFALIHTKDDNCLRYLSRVVHKFNGGAPTLYPVDLFERLWAIDRLERLGISRYFKSEIKECLDYVHRYWTEEGISWARNSFHDLDDTAMGFRLLRLHGHPVSADVFRHFKKGDDFICFVGQSTEAVTVMFNLYRASQVLFPGEKILEDAKKFSSKFLREKQANDELLDKWIISKDLPGEVEYALEVPWYGSLARVETRFYLEQYGGEGDVWIAKTLYRMPYINNNIYLELAKLDFNKSQALHQLEWDTIQRWYAECNFGEFEMSQRSDVLGYYLAAASIFEPERSTERLAWAKTAALVETIVSYFEKRSDSEQRRAFLLDFQNYASHRQFVKNRRYRNTTEHEKRGVLIGIMFETINQLSLDTMLAHGTNISHHLRHAWESWMMRWQETGDMHGGVAELLVRSINLCGGRLVSSNFQHKPLWDITETVCRQLRQLRHNYKVHDKDDEHYKATTMQIESNIQELVRLVVTPSSDGMDPLVTQTFLAIARSYYYTFHCAPETIHFHIAKVLFERVV